MWSQHSYWIWCSPCIQPVQWKGYMQNYHRKKANLLSEISAVEQLKGWSEDTETQSAQLSIPK